MNFHPGFLSCRRFFSAASCGFRFDPKSTRVSDPLSRLLRRSLAVAGAAGLLSCSLAFGQVSTGDRLYQSLKGKQGITAIVANLTPRLLADERIRHTFVEVDMRHLAEKLVEQFCAVSGGPCVYTGKDMKTIHQDMKISNAQFNALVEDLQDAMDAEGVSTAVQNQLLARLAPMQRQVVER
jgi:hemoglobin